MGRRPVCVGSHVNIADDGAHGVAVLRVLYAHTNLTPSPDDGVFIIITNEPIIRDIIGGTIAFVYHVNRMRADHPSGTTLFDRYTAIIPASRVIEEGMTVLDFASALAYLSRHGGRISDEDRAIRAARRVLRRRGGEWCAEYLEYVGWRPSDLGDSITLDEDSVAVSGGACVIDRPVKKYGAIRDGRTESSVCRRRKVYFRVRVDVDGHCDIRIWCDELDYERRCNLSPGERFPFVEVNVLRNVGMEPAFVITESDGDRAGEAFRASIRRLADRVAGWLQSRWVPHLILYAAELALLKWDEVVINDRYVAVMPRRGIPVDPYVYMVFDLEEGKLLGMAVASFPRFSTHWRALVSSHATTRPTDLISLLLPPDACSPSFLLRPMMFAKYCEDLDDRYKAIIILLS